MNTTIIAALALVGSLTPTANPEFRPHTDYTQALKLAAAESKPMAVLIGKGDPFAKLTTDAGMSAEAAKLLRERFVCVAVDVDTAAGAKLAGEFQLTEGLVISSAGGTYQALRQSGAVTAADLSKYTTTHATSTGTPATTVTVGAGAPVYAPTYAPAYSGRVIYGSSCPGGNCGTVVPAGYSYPQPGYTLPTTPFYGSSCPNGRCPNVR